MGNTIIKYNLLSQTPEKKEELDKSYFIEYYKSSKKNNQDDDILYSNSKESKITENIDDKKNINSLINEILQINEELEIKNINKASLEQIEYKTTELIINTKGELVCIINHLGKK